MLCIPLYEASQVFTIGEAKFSQVRVSLGVEGSFDAVSAREDGRFEISEN